MKRLRRKSVHSTSEPQVSLGVFTNLPRILHGYAKLTSEADPLILQRTFIKILGKLNSKKVEMAISLSGHEGLLPGEIGFEVGVAEGDCFNYMDNSEEERLMSVLQSNGLMPVLDSFLIVKCKVKNGRKHSPWFDRYIMRGKFTEGNVEFQLFHERGMRRLSPDELINMLVEELDKRLREEGAPGVKITSLRTA